MANVVDFHKEDKDGSFIYKCTLRGEIRIAPFEEMKLWLENWKGSMGDDEDAERSALLHIHVRGQTQAQSWTENWSKCIRLLYAFLLLTIILNHILLIFILEQGMVYKRNIWS